jgi:hypothetical protein
MTARERIKHEFLLLMLKLGEDNAQFFHCDLCPDPMPEVYNLTLDALFWKGLTSEEITMGCDNPKEFVAGLYLDLCKDAKFKMETLIELLETEKSDAKKA